MSEAVVAPDCSMTSGATANQSQSLKLTVLRVRTPIWAPHNGIVSDRTSCRARYTEIRQFDTSVLVRQDVGSLYVAVDDTLIVQVHQAF